ncbi:MAG TPA: GNAT family N-acetyltransferase [Terriglobales bacterium]
MIEPCLAKPDSSIAIHGEHLRLVVFNAIPDNARFRQAWDELVYRMECPEVFYTCEWAEAVIRAFSGSLQPLIFAAYRGQELAAIAAMQLDSDGYVSFLTALTADYCDLVCAPGDRADVWELLLAHIASMKSIHGLRLANLPADSASVPALRSAAQASRYSIFMRPAYYCAQILLDSPGQRQAAAQAAKRRIKKLAAAGAGLGEVRVEHVRTWEGFAAEFPRFTSTHIERFRAAGQVSNLVCPERQRFAAELAQRLSAKGWLALSALKVKENTVAWNYGFTFANKWFYYQPTFALSARRLSPGTYLLSEIILAACQDAGIGIVDLGLGDEEYKARFAESGRRTLHVTVSGSKTKVAWSAARYHAAALVKRSSGLEKFARLCRNKLHGFRNGAVSQA